MLALGRVRGWGGAELLRLMVTRSTSQPGQLHEDRPVQPASGRRCLLFAVPVTKVALHVGNDLPRQRNGLLGDPG